MRTALISLLFFLAPVSSFAHGDRPSFEAESGPYLIDVGYDAVGFRPGEEVSFDFDLFRDPNGTPSFEPFDVLRVEIRRGEEVVHTQEVVNEQNFVPSMKYTFPEEGAYKLMVGYVRGGSLIADASFDIAVSASSGSAQRIQNIVTYIIATILVLFSFGYMAWSWMQSRKNA